MNKLLIQIISIGSALLILSSCSTQSSMFLTKRHYRSGYYVDLGSKNHPVNLIPVISPQITKKQSPSVAVTKSENIHVTNSQLIVSEKIATAKKNKEPEKRVLYKDEIVNSNSSEQKVSIPNSSFTNTLYAPKDEIRVYVVDVPFIIILLCAIFIPPLGVGLMYGLNIYFWVDLLLTLLFFIPGLIFALIVVLM